MATRGRALLVVLLVGGASTYVWRDELAPYRTWAVRLAEGASLFPGSTAPPASHRYRTAPVKRGDIRQLVTATGTLKAVVTVEVGTQLSGQLSKLFVDFNDEVTKGQPLAELDRQSSAARLAEARAATAMAQTLVEVAKAKIERARVDILDAEARRAVLLARVESARARRVAADSALERFQVLYGRGVASPSQLEQAQAERDAAAANLREAEALFNAHAHAIAGARVDLRRAEAEFASAQAGVPEKKAAQWLAEIEFERTVIRSPVDGIVVGRGFNEGQTVSASLEAPTLFTIAGDLEQMDIHARVDESDIGQIKVGQNAWFTVDAHPDRRFEAKVTAVRKVPETPQQTALASRRGPQTPSNVVSYTVVLRARNSSGLLLPGMTAVTKIQVEEMTDALMVPMAALRFTPQSHQQHAIGAKQAADSGDLVWIQEANGSLRPVTLRVGAVDGVHAAVLNIPPLKGLQEGDQVVVAEVPEAAPNSVGLRFGF